MKEKAGRLNKGKLRMGRNFLAADLVLIMFFGLAFSWLPAPAFSATATLEPHTATLSQVTPSSGSNQAKPVLTNASKAPASRSSSAGAVTAASAGISPTANRVYGQPNFTTNSTVAGGGVSASGLDLPQGVASDAAGG